MEKTACEEHAVGACSRRTEIFPHDAMDNLPVTTAGKKPSGALVAGTTDRRVAKEGRVHLLSRTFCPDQFIPAAAFVVGAERKV